MYRPLTHLTFRALAPALFVAVALALPSTLLAQERIRKSIDELTAQELTDFLHATAKLREKSTSDPTVDYSYAHMAGLHNLRQLFDGACEHWNYRFLAWHRALLYNYEDALRASDPPRTAAVTIPYWNWTAAPTGQRYPVAFENDADGAKAHYGETIAPELLSVLFRSTRNAEPSSALYPWMEIAHIAKPESESESESERTTAFLGGEATHGALETPPHDEMHGFMGGDLAGTGTAANDPIFWSFHAFVDLVWWWRQQEIADTVPCASCRLNGMPARTAVGTDGPVRVEDVTESVEQLGVRYAFTAPERSALQTEYRGRRLSTRLPWHAAKALEQPDVVREFVTTAQATDESVFVVDLVGVRIPTMLAYMALVFVHPSDVAFAQGEVEFRDRYLVGHFGQWANGHDLNSGDTEPTREFPIVVDPNVYPDLAVEPGAQLSVTVAIHIMGTNDSELRETMAEGQGSLRSSALDILEQETAIAGVAETVR